MRDLVEQRCAPIARDAPPLDESSINELLPQVDGWEKRDDHTIQRTFKFKDYYQTISFVNAVAWIVLHEDHHPDMLVSYNKCDISFSTHSVGGLSINDFICAAKINALPYES
ncbi:MAG: 4a-hydroxytetrahydrobiopterin dehydratase [Gammaproteobacteria bacterium]|nr:MAG: 4a-hydroxytetrahydrobiopterin dehydratase [Gammaproteobacteria bacterium]